jgi:hypothetical protein
VRTRLRARSDGDGAAAPTDGGQAAAPGGNFPEQPTSPVLTRMPRPAEAQPRMDNFGDGKFPNGPPPPPPSDLPPPLSPSGRWLHSATLLDGRLYVYGGVGSYSTALYNDLWLYNFVDGQWTQLQSSFVPPFPLADPNRGLARQPNEPIDQFRPADTPPAPAVRPSPDNGPVTTSLNPQQPPREPILQPQRQEPLPVINFEPLPFSANKPVGYASFLETAIALSSRARAGASARAHARALAALRAEVAAQARAGVGVGLSAAARAAVSARHEAVLRMQAGEGPAGAAPPQFWKSKHLAPGVMSPFIAADLWSYDLDTKLWANILTESLNVPAPRWLHTANRLGDRLVVFGGVSYSDVILGDLWVFSPRDKSWLKANPAGSTILPREGHSAVVMQMQTIWVFGGISYGHMPFNDLWMYDGSKNQWTLVKANGQPPPPRWLHAATVFRDDAGNEKMYVFGGITRNWIPLDDLWVLDKNTITWYHPQTKGFPPFPRFLHQLAVLQTKMVVHGGMANNIPLEDMWMYDIVDRTWDEELATGPYPFAREGHACDVVVPPDANVEPQAREPFVPKPLPDDGRDPLMPLITNVTSPRPLNRLRKEVFPNRFLLCFGGAGPKPRLTDNA